MAELPPFGVRDWESKGDVSARLDVKLDNSDLSVRQGPSGRNIHYIAGNKAIQLANDAFTYDGWSCTVCSILQDFADIDSQSRYSVGYTATVRVTLQSGAFHEDIGCGAHVNKVKAEAIDHAKKAAVTDARKRALRVFGELLGNCLHDKEHMARIGTYRKPSLPPRPATAPAATRALAPAPSPPAQSPPRAPSVATVHSPSRPVPGALADAARHDPVREEKLQRQRQQQEEFLRQRREAEEREQRKAQLAQTAEREGREIAAAEAAMAVAAVQTTTCSPPSNATTMVSSVSISASLIPPAGAGTSLSLQGSHGPQGAVGPPRPLPSTVSAPPAPLAQPACPPGTALRAGSHALMPAPGGAPPTHHRLAHGQSGPTQPGQRAPPQAPQSLPVGPRPRPGALPAVPHGGDAPDLQMAPLPAWSATPIVLPGKENARYGLSGGGDPLLGKRGRDEYDPHADALEASFHMLENGMKRQRVGDSGASVRR